MKRFESYSEISIDGLFLLGCVITLPFGLRQFDNGARYVRGCAYRHEPLVQTLPQYEQVIREGWRQGGWQGMNLALAESLHNYPFAQVAYIGEMVKALQRLPATRIRCTRFWRTS